MLEIMTDILCPYFALMDKVMLVLVGRDGAEDELDEYLKLFIGFPKACLAEVIEYDVDEFWEKVRKSFLRDLIEDSWEDVKDWGEHWNKRIDKEACWVVYDGLMGLKESVDDDEYIMDLTMAIDRCFISEGMR